MTKIVYQCPQCENTFEDYTSNRRKYCSKKCHIENQKINVEFNTRLQEWTKHSRFQIGHKYCGGKRGKSRLPTNKKSSTYHMRIWRQKNPELARQQRKKYKYNKKMAGKLSIKTIQLVYEDNIKKYGTLTCYLCEEPIAFGKDHLEHKTPLSRGGKNVYENLSIACQKCNNKKYTKTEKEYLMERRD